MSHLEFRSAGEPVTGWRYWQLAIGATASLRSLSQRGFVWRPEKPMVARCANGVAEAQHQDVPDSNCGCGIHASIDVASLHAQALCLRPVPLVVGEVALWGRVITEQRNDQRGLDHRGQFAYPQRLSVVAETLVDVTVAEAVEGLGVYGVPVGVMPLSNAVGELSQTIMNFLAMSRNVLK